MFFPFLRAVDLSRNESEMVLSAEHSDAPDATCYYEGLKMCNVNAVVECRVVMRKGV